MRLRVVVLMFAFAAALSCAGPTEPRVTGRFALVRMGGEALPRPTMATSTDTIFADTITIGWNVLWPGRGVISHQLRVRGYPSGLPVSGTYTDSIRQASGFIEFIAPPCPDAAFTECFYAGRSGVLTGDTLRVTFVDPAFRQLIYVRF